MAAAPKLLLEQGMRDPATLNPHPSNPKLHNQTLLNASVAKGLYRPIVVNRGTLTGRPDEILAGHGTCTAWMEAHPGEPVQVSYVDVDDQRATEILLIDNPGPNDPGYDNHALIALLGTIDLEQSVTGYYQDDLDKLLADLSDTITPDPVDPTPPDEFGEYGSDIVVTYGCPSCGYEWSGKPNAATHTPPPAG
jgi:hypothetical protein